MEKSFLEEFMMPKEKAKQLNPQVLAFVGDSVYTLYVRSFLVHHYEEKSGKLHLYANEYVKAKGQSDALLNLENWFSQEEKDIYKRARNYKTKSVAKNQNVIDYHRATGLEAVVGYLYLSGQYDRLEIILQKSIAQGKQTIEKGK